MNIHQTNFKNSDIDNDAGSKLSNISSSSSSLNSSISSDNDDDSDDGNVVDAHGREWHFGVFSDRSRIL